MDPQTITAYNKMAEEYDQETKDFWELFPITFEKKFKDLLQPADKVLDVGSGPGRDGLKMKIAGLEVVCLDASSVMVERCKKLGLEAIEGDFLDLPFTDQSFNAVWAYTSLLHIPKSKLSAALAEINRVLKPNGIFALGMIDGEVEEYRSSAGVSEPRYFAFYKKEELEGVVKQSGFTEIYFEDFIPRSKKYLNFIFKKL